MTNPAPVRLEIEGYVLRPLTREDSPEAFRRWAADPELMGPMNLPARALSAEQVAEYWGGFNNVDRFFLGIFAPGSGDHIGFWMTETNPLHRTATVYLAVDRAHQDREVAFLTGIAHKDWLFGPLGIEKIIGTTLSINVKVIQAFERSGWMFEGNLRQEVCSLNGDERLDQVRYGMLAADWPAIRARLAERWRERTGRVLPATVTPIRP